MQVLTLEISNWEKYNPRSDVKSSSWFRMDNDFLTDPDFYGTSLTLKFTWLSILSTASRKMSAVIKANTKQIADSLNTHSDEIYSCILQISEIRSTTGGAILVIHGDPSKITTIESDRTPQSNCPLRTDERTNVTDVTNETSPKKNLSKKNPKDKRKMMEKSPLATLFSATDEIQVWLLTGTESVQRELLSRYSHHVLAEEIKKAYFWQLERQARQAGTFLLTWMGNSKTSGYGLNSSKAEITEANPTGNPYKAKRLAQEKSGASA